MDHIPGSTSRVAIETAVRETMKRVNTNALALLERQSQINRRIRDLHRVIRRLRHLAAKPEFEYLSKLEAQKALSNESAGTGSQDWTKLLSPLQSRRSLSRSCRIALLECSGFASLEQVRSRILQRSSFSFDNPALMNMAILRTLTRMTKDGEIQCLEHGTHKLWRRSGCSGDADS